MSARWLIPATLTLCLGCSQVDEATGSNLAKDKNGSDEDARRAAGETVIDPANGDVPVDGDPGANPDAPDYDPDAVTPGTGDVTEAAPAPAPGIPGARKVDILIVLDNSGTIKTTMDQIQAELASAVTAASLPADHRIAVMNTMPADPKDLTKVHPRVVAYPYINREPGFMGLVSRARIANYLKARPLAASKFPIKGCESAWFLANDVDPEGKRCLFGATQVAAKGVVVEAGLQAFEDFVKKLGTNPLFRERAEAHVIIISDTQQPGTRTAVELIGLKTSFRDLELKVIANSKTSKLMFHGFVPGPRCSSEDNRFFGYPYNFMADASKGVAIDICDETNSTSDGLASIIAKIKG